MRSRLEGVQMGMEKLTTGRDAELADTLRRVIVDGIRAEVELGGARQMESRARVTEDYRGRLRRCSSTSLKRLGHVTRNSSPNNSCGSTTGPASRRGWTRIPSAPMGAWLDERETLDV